MEEEGEQEEAEEGGGHEEEKGDDVYDFFGTGGNKGAVEGSKRQ